MSTTQTDTPRADAPTTEIKKRAVTLGSFGDGRYSPVMKEFYADMKRLLGFSDVQAHVAAERLGIDLGRLSSASVTKDNIKISAKASKDGFRTLKEVASVKTQSTWAMNIAVVCVGLDELRKQGLVVNDCGIHKDLLERVNEAAVKIEAAKE